MHCSVACSRCSDLPQPYLLPHLQHLQDKATKPLTPTRAHAHAHPPYTPAHTSAHTQSLTQALITHHTFTPTHHTSHPGMAHPHERQLQPSRHTSNPTSPQEPATPLPGQYQPGLQPHAALAPQPLVLLCLLPGALPALLCICHQHLASSRLVDRSHRRRSQTPHHTHASCRIEPWLVLLAPWRHAAAVGCAWAALSKSGTMNQAVAQSSLCSFSLVLYSHGGVGCAWAAVRKCMTV